VESEIRLPGQPLEAATRAYFEPRFGQDFRDVRVHSNDGAAVSAREVNARAYTVGSDIVFGAGEFAPTTQTGRGLLAHELAHTVQQRNASDTAHLSVESRAVEPSAEAAGEIVASGRAVSHALPGSGRALARAPAMPDRGVGKTGQTGNSWTEDDLLRALVTMRRNDPQAFVKFLVAGERTLDPLLSQYGFHGSWVADSDYLKDFDATIARWGKAPPVSVTSRLTDIGMPNNQTSMSAVEPGTVYRTMSVEQEFHMKMDNMLDSGVAVLPAAIVLAGRGEERANQFMANAAPVGGVIQAMGGAYAARASMPYNDPVDNTDRIAPVPEKPTRTTTNPPRVESTGAWADARASTSAQAAIQDEVNMGFLDPALARPGANVATGTAQTARSITTGVRSQTAEITAYEARMSRGEIGLLAPSGSNVPGPDYATAVPLPTGDYEIVIGDAKSRVSSSSAFGQVRNTLPATWSNAVNDAVSAGRLGLESGGRPGDPGCLGPRPGAHRARYHRLQPTRPGPASAE